MLVTTEACQCKPEKTGQKEKTRALGILGTITDATLASVEFQREGGGLKRRSNKWFRPSQIWQEA